MENEIEPLTAPGRKMVATAEHLAADFEKSAATNDREGRFPHEHIERLRDCGYIYAPLPVECGGWGVSSVHDIMVASSRLARGDAGITLGVNMHLVVMRTFLRQWEIAKHRGIEARIADVAATMQRFVDDGVVIAAASSEADQKLTYQATRAERNGNGWTVNGRKIICSMAPAATHFTVAMNYTDESGVERFVFTLVERNAPGVTVHDDWDALGMRSSGSVTVSLDGVHLNGRGPGKGSIAGTITPEYIESFLMSGPAHAAGSLGVAEAAFDAGVSAVHKRVDRLGDDALRSTYRHLAAESSVELAAARAVFSRSLQLIDQHYANFPTGYGELAADHAVFAEAQRAKAFINQAAVRIVDRAMTMSGGGAYMSKHPLSRYWRDVRAGAFMHPLGANLAYEYIGGVALGMQPSDL